ncbi:MAG: AMP-binding protein [Pseudomonadota bacterium]
MTIYTSPYGEIKLTGQSITERLFQGLSKRPDAVAMVDGPTGRGLTGAEIMTAIRSLAGGLTAAGLGAGHTVAIMAPNLPEFCIVFHAVAWAGGTVTTINPTYTAAEVKHQLKDAGAEALVTVSMFEETARTAMDGSDCDRLILIDSDGDTGLSGLMGSQLENQYPVDVTEHVVVMPYSSGTTGLPKGVMLTHRNLVANVDQIAPLADIREGEVHIAFLPFFHIFGMTAQMNLFLGEGAVVVTMPRFDLELCLDLIQTHGARQMYIVPPVALALAKHPLVDQYDLSSLDILLSGAAPLDAALAEAVEARLGCKMIQGYGMTEMSPASHFNHVHNPKIGAAGQTAPGTETRIVSAETGADCALGEEGEVWVRGPQVMKGYLGRPDATAEAMTPDGWLRTGDLGVMDADGYLFIRDRLKELIKVKGFQVAPAELEAALIAHPAIADAGVVGIPDEEAGERPLAFVALASEAELSEADVIAHAAADLATYKHLSAVRFVDAIPKSASGKILRRVLREQV